jgi:hypothetical protein
MRVVIGLLAFLLGWVLIKMLVTHLWLALLFAIVAGLVGRHYHRRNV